MSPPAAAYRDRGRLRESLALVQEFTGVAFLVIPCVADIPGGANGLRDEDTTSLGSRLVRRHHDPDVHRPAARHGRPVHEDARQLLGRGQQREPVFLSTAAIYGDKEADLATATAVDIPTTALSATANGAYYGTEYVDLDVTKQIIEVGLRCKNSSGTKMEKAFVTLIVDFLE